MQAKLIDSEGKLPCSRCEERLPATEEFFYLANTRSGFSYNCRECYKMKSRESNQRTKEADHSAWTEQRARHKKVYKEKNPERYKESERKSNLWKLYRITPEQYDALSEAQGGVCAICTNPPNGLALAVDHDHTCCPGRKSCGKCIRGLLCASKCNISLGNLEAHLQEAMDYIVKFRLL